jgi:hypothetical protein
MGIFEILIAGMISLFVASTADTPAKDYLESQIQVEYNEETGLTDYTIAGHTASFDVEYRYDFND